MLSKNGVYVHTRPTTYALNQLIWISESEVLTDKYYFLLDFAEQHPESSQIFAAID